MTAEVLGRDPASGTKLGQSTSHLIGFYGVTAVSQRAGAAQATSAVATASSADVTTELKAAVIEIAAQGAPAVTASRLKESVTVGPISTTYAPGTDPAQGIAKHKYALRLLAGLVRGDAVGNSIELVRA